MSSKAIEPGYTTTGKVRAALGLTDNEILDEFFNQDLGEALELDLVGWLPTHGAIWTAFQGSGATADERQQGLALQLYSLWFCTAQIAELWMAMPQKISDGKADLRRFTDLDLEKLAENAASRRDEYRALLVEILDPDAVPSNAQMVTASPGYDVVVGA